jgi:hypothetical protein
MLKCLKLIDLWDNKAAKEETGDEEELEVYQAIRELSSCKGSKLRLSKEKANKEQEDCWEPKGKEVKMGINTKDST